MEVISAQNKSGATPKSEKINWQQIMILVLLCYSNFWSSCCFSLIAPFFPEEAEAKGATPSQYGLILSVYPFMFLITSPLLAKYSGLLRLKTWCSLSILIESLSYILFGFLIWISNRWLFIGLSLVLRMVGGSTCAAIMGSSSVIVWQVFPKQPVLMLTVVTAHVHLGVILGPTIGGALYQWSGFIMPFAVMGLFLMVGSILVQVHFPQFTDESQSRPSIWSFMSDPGAILDGLTIVLATIIVGYNTSTLEPHLRQFDLKPFIIGCIFITTGMAYGATVLVWAYLCDKGWDPRKLCLVGNISYSVGFLLIGPQVFIPLDTKLWLIIVSLIAIGLGITGTMVTAFVSLMNDSVNRRGLPDTYSTYMAVLSFYMFFYSIGTIVGSSLGGFLLEKLEYRKSTFPLLIVEVVMTLLLMAYILCNRLLIGRQKKMYFESNKREDMKF